MSKTKRIEWVDGAKGISILLVVIMYGAYSVGEATNNTGFLHYIVGFTTPFRMPEFFLLSGLFLSNVIARAWPIFLDRRFVHYLYFYALWAIILIVAKVAIFSADPINAALWIVIAIYKPFSVFWFIYILAFFSLAVKIAYSLKIPHWAILIGAALLQIAPINTPSYAINQFCEYLIYFYSGYVFAPKIFGFISYFEDRILLAISIIFGFFIINSALIFLPSYSINPASFDMGFAALPVLNLTLAFLGTLAVCLTASMLVKVKFMYWLSYIGKHSIVIFLTFSLPMGIFREIFIKTGLINDTGTLSILVSLIAIISSLILYWLVKKTNIGKFLFFRPQWAFIHKAKN